MLIFGAVAIALIAVTVWLLGWDPNVIAAGASAIAALAALASAIASNQTARDATRALSYATKPHLTFNLQGMRSPSGDGSEHVALVIGNTSPQPVGRASISWRRFDGTKGEKELGPLPANGKGEAGRYEAIYLGPPVPLDVKAEDQFVLEYYGAFGGVGWRRAVTYFSRPTTGSYGYGFEEVSESEVG